MTFRLFQRLVAEVPRGARQIFTRGKPPWKARNIQQRIAALEYRNPELFYKVDIGFKVPQYKNACSRKEWINQVRSRRQNKELERLAMRNQLIVDKDTVDKEWLLENYSKHTYLAAEHYDIYKNLYRDGYFYPVLPLEIDYDYGHPELLARVHRGNVIQPNEARSAPNVTYKTKPETLWTLLLTTPDGNYSDPRMEYCHWFIGNIPGNDLAKGEQIIDYMRPIPPKGVGFYRYIFVLYKQDKKIDFSEYKKELPCLQLVERNWKTYEFMKKHEDYVTPAGLAFFQASYDHTVKDFYHETLEMQMPILEYDFPAHYNTPQTWFPLREAFNLYLDRYRDPKQIAKEFLIKKLKKEHPFKFPDPPLKYPNAHKIETYTPSWLKTEIKKERLSWGRINEYK